MPSVNFLSSHDDEEEIKKKEVSGEGGEIKWTEPVKEKKDTIASFKAVNPEKSLGGFSFFRKKEKAQHKEKLNNSRKEIIDIIKRETKKKPSFFAGLFKGGGKRLRRAEEIPTEYHHTLHSSSKNNIVIDVKKEELKNIIKDIKPIQQSVSHDSIKMEAVSPVNTKKEENKEPEKKILVANKENGLSNGKTPDWENPDLLETNLIKGEVAYFFDWKRGVIIFIVSIVLSGLVVFGAYKGVSYWGAQLKPQEDIYAEKIEELQKEINPLEKDSIEIKNFQDRFKLTSDLFNKHVYWTNFFDFLEKNTTQDVYYFSFVGDTGGNYSIDSRARNFKAIVDQLNIMRLSGDVSEVKIRGGNLSGGDNELQGEGASFKLELSVKPEIFFK